MNAPEKQVKEVGELSGYTHINPESILAVFTQILGAAVGLGISASLLYATAKESKSVGDFVKNTLASLNFINPFGSQSPQLRYPLGDIQKHQNVIKFEAIARVKRSSVLDFRVAKFAESALGSVTLYMPSGISVADTLSYDNADTGIGGEIMKAGGSSASPGEFVDTLKGQAKGVAQIGK